MGRLFGSHLGPRTRWGRGYDELGDAYGGEKYRRAGGREK